MSTCRRPIQLLIAVIAFAASAEVAVDQCVAAPPSTQARSVTPNHLAATTSSHTYDYSIPEWNVSGVLSTGASYDSTGALIWYSIVDSASSVVIASDSVSAGTIGTSGSVNIARPNWPAAIVTPNATTGKVTFTQVITSIYGTAITVIGRER